MNVILFGASGMVGGGVLTECLEDPVVGSVVSVGRRGTGVSHAKLREVTVPDLFDLASHQGQLGRPDACFYCLGVSSAGMTEAAYGRITLDLTVAVADVLSALNPHMTFCFVSGQGTDGTGSGRVMWARIKGQAENELFSRDFTTYAFRPGVIRPLKGARSGVKAYQLGYTLLTPVFPLLERLLPGAVTTTVRLGRAMIHAAGSGYEKPVLETRDINALASRGR